MVVKFSPEFLEKLQAYSKKDKQITKLFKKQLTLFMQNSNYPSLRKHKLTGKLKNMYSISVNMSIRAVYVLKLDGSIYFTAIGTHDEVYK